MTWSPSYATTEELAEFIRVGDSLDDAQLGLAIAAASRAIDRACNRQFGVLDAAAARYYTAQWDRKRCRWYVAIDDLMTTDDLVVEFDEDDDQTYAATITDYRLHAVNAAAESRPWTELVVRDGSTVQPTCLEDGVRIVARWGWLPSWPDPIKEACLLQSSRVIARRDAPFGVAGSPDAGSEIRLLARLDPDVTVAIRPFWRAWGAV